MGWGSDQCLGGGESLSFSWHRGPNLCPGTIQSTTFALSASSSAADLPPAVPMDPEPGAFPQEPPLDTLPGELTPS